MLRAEARRHAGRVLVVCNKRVRARLEALGMPGNVELAHFNALRGLDRWHDVVALIVVGWTLPAASVLEQQVGALTGAALPATGYQRAEARRELADGTCILSETWRHPNPVAEALRWSACEAELIQAIGRGRGVRRTATSPLDVLVLGEAVLPFPVELVPLDHPGSDDVQFAHGAIAYAEPSHAARAYPQLYMSANATRMAWSRWRTASYKQLPIGECAPPPDHVRVRYQRAGAGQRPAEAVIDLARCPDPRAAVEHAQGILAAFELPEPPSATNASVSPACEMRSRSELHSPCDHVTTAQSSTAAGTGPPGPIEVTSRSSASDAGSSATSSGHMDEAFGVAVTVGHSHEGGRCREHRELWGAHAVVGSSGSVGGWRRDLHSAAQCECLAFPDASWRLPRDEQGPRC